LEKTANARTHEAKRSGTKPSIETLMHTLLGPFTLHTHPIAITNLVCRKNWQEIARELLPQAHMIPYTTPGILLALSLYDALEPAGFAPEQQLRVYFLENHGLVVAGPNARAVMDETARVSALIAQHLGLDLARYALSNRVSALIQRSCGVELCAYLSDDAELKETARSAIDPIAAPPAFPDQAVYCGPAGLIVSSLDDPVPIKQYAEKYGQVPKVLLYRPDRATQDASGFAAQPPSGGVAPTTAAESSELFLLGQNVRKCKEMEDVLKAHVMTLRPQPEVMKFLDRAEVEYLLQWDAEKYRQQL
ncbi:MAG: class II aldolase/adducin family protein, partial [Terriglobales bacterium]